jgi:hypothetical protein
MVHPDLAIAMMKINWALIFQGISTAVAVATLILLFA